MIHSEANGIIANHLFACGASVDLGTRSRGVFTSTYKKQGQRRKHEAHALALHSRHDFARCVFQVIGGNHI